MYKCEYCGTILESQYKNCRNCGASAIEFGSVPEDTIQIRGGIGNVLIATWGVKLATDGSYGAVNI